MQIGRVLLIVIVCLGFVSGYVLWATSESLVGTKEPWDGAFFYYSSVVATVAFFSALFCVRLFFVGSLCNMAGQIVYMYTNYDELFGSGAVIFPIWVSVPVHSVVPACLGVLLGIALNRYGSKKRKETGTGPVKRRQETGTRNGDRSS